MLFLTSPLFLFKQSSPPLPGTEVIVWDRLESPSVNILFMTKLLSLDPLSWAMDRLLTLWPLLIPCSLGNCCCVFGFLIFIIVIRNFLYHSLYTLIEKSLKHICSIRAWVPVSVFLSFFLSLSLSLWLSLSLSYCRLWTTRFRSIKGPQQVVPRTWTLVYVAFRMEWLQAYWGQGLLRSVSTKTRVKLLERPIISLLYFTICLKLRDILFHANE